LWERKQGRSWKRMGGGEGRSKGRGREGGREGGRGGMRKSGREGRITIDNVY
jgi:hypothetical protein